MRLGEILDGSFNIYRRHFGLFMRLSLILIWLPLAVGLYLNLRFVRSPFEFISIFQEHMGATIGIILSYLAVAIACSLLLLAGTIRVISDSYLGQEPELGAALRFGVDKLIPLLLVTFSKGLLILLLGLVSSVGVALLYFMGRIVGPGMGAFMIFIGVVAAIWFVIWVLCAYATTAAVVVLEDLPSAFDAFGRSWELTRGARLKVFGTAAVAWLISQFLPRTVIGGINGVLGFAGNDSLQPYFVVVASLMGIVLAPILPCALTLLYYDLRVRREAFDLQVLSEQMGTGMTETR